MKELEDFIESVLNIYDIPKLPSYEQAIATMIMHLGPLETHKPKLYFARSIKKAAANQIAYEKIQQIREKEKEQAALDKAQGEASESKGSEAQG